MNALAKTSDFSSDFDESAYQSPPVFTTNSLWKESDSGLTNLLILNTVADENCISQRKINHLHLLPQKPANFARTFQLLQQWEGKVEKINGDTFVAVITDKTNTNNSDEEAEIFFSEIAKDDQPYVRPGAFFYWSVGYEDGLGVPRQRVSRFRFRRLPGITSRDIRRAEKNAAELADLFA